MRGFLGSCEKYDASGSSPRSKITSQESKRLGFVSISHGQVIGKFVTNNHLNRHLVIDSYLALTKGFELFITTVHLGFEHLKQRNGICQRWSDTCSGNA